MRDSQINPYDHSDIKVQLLKIYLEKYINILSLAQGVKEVEVYDLFCGEGIYENGKEGSPVIILKLIKDIFYRNKVRASSVVKYNCHFNDISKNKIDKLRRYIQLKKIHYPEIGTLNFHSEDYQNIKTKVSSKNIPGCKSFVFIDPYGYKEISIEDIKQMLSNRHTEVLLFLPTQFMYRFEKDATPNSLYKFLTEVLTEEELGKSISGIDFINKLRDGFGNILKDKHYVDSFIITRDVNQYFALFFFTSHLYGFEKFLEAKWDIDESEGRGWSSSFSKVDLFSKLEVQANTDKFEENIVQYIHEKRSNIEIHKFTIENRHLIKHTVQILKNLQNTNKLEVLLMNGNNARKGSFYIGWNEAKSKVNKCFIKIKLWHNPVLNGQK